MGGNDGGVDVADEISLLLKSSPNINEATNYFKMLGQERLHMISNLCFKILISFGVYILMF